MHPKCPCKVCLPYAFFTKFQEVDVTFARHFICYQCHVGWKFPIGDLNGWMVYLVKFEQDVPNWRGLEAHGCTLIYNFLCYCLSMDDVLGASKT